MRNKIEITDEKINETTGACSFDNLSKLENKIGFEEKGKNEKFFRKGENKEWEKVLSPELIKKIENNFLDELKELNYI